jgi:UDP-glucose 4-epimerase
VGGSGYIGSQTAKCVVHPGLAPVVFDNLVYGYKWAVEWGPFVEGDLADGALNIPNIEAIVEHAWRWTQKRADGART